MRRFGELEAVIMDRLLAYAGGLGLLGSPMLLALTPAVVALALGKLPAA